MSSNKKISIIIPTFNVEDYIDYAMNSILRQTFGFSNLEVIFVDDCSTDNTRDIIEVYTNRYNNVYGYYLDENSGFAGKPRNVGIEKASSEFIMFLDPDDMFMENACEVLYNIISKNNVDLVSGNYVKIVDNKEINNSWNLLDLKDNKIEVKDINGEPKLLRLIPSLWAKIYRKEFILKNNIDFLVGVPAQDLVFVSECLLKASGIVFIDVPVVKYKPRSKGDEKSVTSTRDKKVLSGFIKSYMELYNILKDFDEKYTWLSPRNLYFWSKQFSLSKLPLSDKYYLLKSAEFLFEEFHKSQLKPQKGFELFFELVNKKKFVDACRLSNRLSLSFKENEEKCLSIIKKIPVFMLFYGFDMNIGGLAKAVFNRANLLSLNGYDIKLLNVDSIKNFNKIKDNAIENGYLEKDVNFINIFDYYSEKNSLDFNKASLNNMSFLDSFDTTKIQDSYLIYKNIDVDESFMLDYYDKNCINTDSNYEKQIVDKLNSIDKIKSEKYIDNYLVHETFYKDDSSEEHYYTKDGFEYFSSVKINNEKIFTLYDRFGNSFIKFRSMNEFYEYFVTELCLDLNEKPFLINDCSGPIPSIENIDSSIAYKIGVLHSNPYLEPHCFGSPMRNVAVLKNVSDLDKLIVLTDTQKEDLEKEFNLENIVSIPNFIYNDDLSKNIDYKKNDNVVSIFSRLAPEKNLEDVLKAFKIVCKSRKDAILKIYGRALKDSEIKEFKKLQKLLKELDIEKNVIFEGHVDNAYEEMGKSLCTLLVSHFEGFSMVILESMFNKTPVICYDINYGPKEVIVHGKNGYLVEQYNIRELAKYILNLLNNPSKAIKMGKSARRDILNKFSSKQVLIKWNNVFKSIYIDEKIDFINNDRKCLSEFNISNGDMNILRENVDLRSKNKFLRREISYLKNELNSSKKNIFNIFSKKKKY